MRTPIPQRRKMTAREAAERTGLSPRTIRRIAAEPRNEYISRAATRRTQAVKLRQRGMKYAEIAAELGCSMGTVGSLLHDARKNGEWPAEQRDSA